MFSADVENPRLPGLVPGFSAAIFYTASLTFSFAQSAICKHNTCLVNPQTKLLSGTKNLSPAIHSLISKQPDVFYRHNTPFLELRVGTLVNPSFKKLFSYAWDDYLVA